MTAHPRDSHNKESAVSKEFQENQQGSLSDEMKAIEAMRKKTTREPKNVPEDEGDDGDAGEVSSVPVAPKVAKEGYKRVRFHVKSRPDDDDDVTLAVNGDVLKIQRSMEVVIPDRYVECAKNARYPQFKQMPNQPRKIVGEILVYPYDMLGDATEAEYLQMREAGTKSDRAALAQS